MFREMYTQFSLSFHKSFGFNVTIFRNKFIKEYLYPITISFAFRSRNKHLHFLLESNVAQYQHSVVLFYQQNASTKK